MMDVNTPEEEYILEQTQKLQPTDPCGAKAWIITAKTLFPNNFNIQFESYKLEKAVNNYEEAAKCFSFIILNFPGHNSTLLWNEVNELTTALRKNENEITTEQEFYVKMFHHVTPDVQHKILLLTVNHTENSLSQCNLLLLILKRFPQAAVTHSPRLLEMIADGIKQNPQKYQEMLVEEALPLIYHKTPELSPTLVCRLYTISLEYYIRQMIDEDTTHDTNEIWKKIFQVLLLCGKILKWETFLPFNRTWGQNVYWDKLIEIVSTSPGGSTQVLFYAATLFIYSLYCYIKNCNIRSEDAELIHVLVEGFRDWTVEHAEQGLEPPQISITTPSSKELSKAFVHAAQCWQLLNTEHFQLEFSKLLLSLPLAPWISRFLFDLAIYFGHLEEAKNLMNDMNVKNSLIHNIQMVSLDLLSGSLTIQGFESILKVLADLPPQQGQALDHLKLQVPRHMIFIPLTQKALVQYCTKAIIEVLSRKLYEPNCPDHILGDLLVLLQLEYPRETLMAEQIFSLITTRQKFKYHLFSSYIITIDFIEEFMFIWQSNNEDSNFDFSSNHPSSSSNTRRIGTRGTDKGAKEDFRLIIKQQIARANENLTTLIANFITKEHVQLVQKIFVQESNNF